MGAQERTMQAEERVEERVAEVDEKHRITSQKINELSWKKANCDADLAMLAKARLELESQAQAFTDKMRKRETEFERLRVEREAEMEEKEAALREDIARTASTMRSEAKRDCEARLKAAKEGAKQEAQKIRDQAEKEVNEKIETINKDREQLDAQMKANTAEVRALKVSLDQREREIQEKLRYCEEGSRKHEPIPQQVFKMALESFAEGRYPPSLPIEDQHLLEDGKKTPEAVFQATVDDLSKMCRKRHTDETTEPAAAAHGVVRTLIALHAWASAPTPQDPTSTLTDPKSSLAPRVEQLAFKIAESHSACDENVYLHHAILSVASSLFMRSCALKKLSKNYYQFKKKTSYHVKQRSNRA